MTRVIFDVQENVNPHFESVWTTSKPYIILQGGRSSFKSSVIALKLAVMIVRYIAAGEKANVIVIRKVAATIRDSVFRKIQWALRKLGLLDQFKMTVAPFQIIHRETGSAFHFYGQDDFEKLKSNDINHIIAVWYEEASEFGSQEDFDQTNATFIRQKHDKADHVKVFWSYNPPRNPYSWINEWATKLEGEPDYLVHKSSYLDDELGFVTDQMIVEIDRIKANDYDYYRYLYLGEPVGLGNNVYNWELFKKVDAIPDDEFLVYIMFGLDTGHQQSATADICAGLTNKGNLYILDMYYYSPAGKARKKAPSELAKDVKSFEDSCLAKWPKPVLRRTIDSAEGALRNEYYNTYGIRFNPVAKKKKITMTEYVVSMLAQGRLFYLPFYNVAIFESEHKSYRWEEHTLATDNPRVVKDDDHSCDALQYLVLDNARELNLVW